MHTMKLRLILNDRSFERLTSWIQLRPLILFSNYLSTCSYLVCFKMFSKIQARFTKAFAKPKRLMYTVACRQMCAVFHVGNDQVNYYQWNMIINRAGVNKKKGLMDGRLWKVNNLLCTASVEITRIFNKLSLIQL